MADHGAHSVTLLGVSAVVTPGVRRVANRANPLAPRRSRVVRCPGVTSRHRPVARGTPAHRRVRAASRVETNRLSSDV
ncbi:hypothetical protein CLV68_2152 [Actinokineospora cianjurensis]|uniref:Uncharacterized protein n=1 Tax=Actinokineospora cianjurensis TaxID=585224 RepID=A0A421BB88_9PSEU|nr:hypothetical protein CLV68_2152 [Actinokineospora cianjurensis]